MPDKIQFFPIDVTYKVIDEKPVIHLFGRTSDDKQICVLYDSFEPYFYVIPKKGYDLANELKNLKITRNDQTYQITRAEPVKKKYLGQDVNAVKVFTKLPRDVPAMREELKNWDSIESINENDILFVKRFLIDSNIVPLTLYEAEGNFVAQRLKVPAFKAEKIEPFGTETLLNPMILSIDIETYTPPYKEIAPEKNPIIMISFYAKDFQRVFVWKRFKTELDYVEFVESEAELIEKFKEALEAYKPDILTGYFSDGFDLPYIKARADKLEIKIPLGLDDSSPKFSRGGFAGSMTGKIKGIVHLDILKFIRTAYSQYMQSETLSLNEVSNEFLGEGKKDFVFQHSSKISDENWEKYFEYNLHDSALVFRLFEKVWYDIIGFSRVMQDPIFEVSRNGMSKNVESYILHNLDKFGEIPEKKPTHGEIAERRYMEKYEGAFVFEPIPGIYENIAVFDFTSSYGSVIVTYNLSKSTFVGKNLNKIQGKNTHHVETNGENLYFSKKEGFFPEMLKK